MACSVFVLCVMRGAVCTGGALLAQTADGARRTSWLFSVLCGLCVTIVGALRSKGDCVPITHYTTRCLVICDDEGTFYCCGNARVVELLN